MEFKVSILKRCRVPLPQDPDRKGKLFLGDLSQIVNTGSQETTMNLSIEYDHKLNVLEITSDSYAYAIYGFA